MTELRAQLQSSLGSSYTLERELAGGGMARVFVAEDRTLDRKGGAVGSERGVAERVSVVVALTQG